MYIIKNALRCICRSKGRSILIGIIALVIAVSACLGLSIRQAAENAKETTVESMKVTATISYDRSSMMEQIGDSFQDGMTDGDFSFDRDQFADMMGSASSLTLEEYQTYATAESVQDFYYTLTAYFNGSDGLSPVTDETTEDTQDDSSESENSGSSMFPGNMGGGMMGGMMSGGMMNAMFSTGDFTIEGYNSYAAMTDFVEGNSTVLDGEMFDEGTSDYTCVISEELAIYNGLSVGDTIVITNPSLETETYTLTISGIYTSESNNDFSMSMFGAGQDPANKIYMSSDALQAIVDASEAASTTITNEYSGAEEESAVEMTVTATYVFADTDAYYAFEEQARALGLDESYTISSTDITSYENRLTPLNTLSTMAGWFLIVILIIGAVILVVLNIFNVRERKYEVGVLTAMGMKKWKVATQFICEILVVTMLAVVIGVGVGAVSSIPVTNALLEGQVESQNSQQTQLDNAFGKPVDMGSMMGGMMGNMPNMPSDLPSDVGGGNNIFGNLFGEASDYVSQVDSAMNLTVVWQMIGVGLLLTLIASAASVLFIMRYDPLKILANRD